MRSISQQFGLCFKRSCASRFDCIFHWREVASVFNSAVKYSVSARVQAMNEDSRLMTGFMENPLMKSSDSALRNCPDYPNLDVVVTLLLKERFFPTQLSPQVFNPLLQKYNFDLVEVGKGIRDELVPMVHSTLALQIQTLSLTNLLMPATRQYADDLEDVMDSGVLNAISGGASRTLAFDNRSVRVQEAEFMYKHRFGIADKVDAVVFNGIDVSIEGEHDRTLLMKDSMAAEIRSRAKAKADREQPGKVTTLVEKVLEIESDVDVDTKELEQPANVGPVAITKYPAGSVVCRVLFTVYFRQAKRATETSGTSPLGYPSLGFHFDKGDQLCAVRYVIEGCISSHVPLDWRIVDMSRPVLVTLEQEKVFMSLTDVSKWTPEFRKAMLSGKEKWSLE